MNEPESLASPLSLKAAGDNDFSDEPLLTAKRAAFQAAGTQSVFPRGELPDGYEFLIPLRRSQQSAA